MKKNESRTSRWLKRTLGVVAVSLALFGASSAYAQVGTPPHWSGTVYNDAIVSTGADQLHAIGITGRGVSSAVLDTLFDVNHPEFSANIVYAAHYTEGSGANNIAPNGGAIGTINVGTNFVNSSDLLTSTWNPINNSGTQHGSHVAGIVHSMAPGAGLVLLNTTAQNASGTTYSAFTQTDVLLDHTADIASTYNIVSFNGSYGSWSPPYDEDGNAPPLWAIGGNVDDNRPATVAALAKLSQAGVIGIFATGNESYNNYIAAPSAVTGAVPVGAINPNGLVTSFSNQNKNVVLLAPGQSVFSTIPAWDGTQVVHAYASWQGTSMAAPHVTGGIALISSGARMASTQEILQSMIDTADPIIYDGNLVVSAMDYFGRNQSTVFNTLAAVAYGIDASQSQTVETWRRIERLETFFDRYYNGTNFAIALSTALPLANQIDESLEHTDYRFLRVDKAYMDLTEKRMHRIADRVEGVGSNYGDVMDAFARELGGRLDQDTADIFQRLDAWTPGVQATVARQMSPAFLNSTAESAHFGMIGLHRAFGHRTEISRLGKGRTGSAYGACKPCGPCEPEPCEPCEPCQPCEPACGKKGATFTSGWVEGFGDFADRDGTWNSSSYDGQFAGVSFGVERSYRNVTWGIFGSYGNHLVKGEGRSEGDWGNVGLYGRVDRRRGFLEGSVAYGYGDYDLDRSVSIPWAIFTDSTPGQFIVLDPMQKNAKASTTANNISTRIGAGRDMWKINGWKVGPRGEFSLSYTDFDAYTEHGADSLNLRVNRYKTTYLEGGIGLHAGKKFVRGSQLFVASAKVMGMYGGMVGDDLKGRFIAGGNNFRVEADHMSTAWVAPEASLSWKVSDGIVLTGTYTGRFGEKYSSNAVGAALNLYW